MLILSVWNLWVALNALIPYYPCWLFLRPLLQDRKKLLNCFLGMFDYVACLASSSSLLHTFFFPLLWYKLILALSVCSRTGQIVMTHCQCGPKTCYVHTFAFTVAAGIYSHMEGWLNYLDVFLTRPKVNAQNIFFYVNMIFFLSMIWLRKLKYICFVYCNSTFIFFCDFSPNIVIHLFISGFYL